MGWASAPLAPSSPTGSTSRSAGAIRSGWPRAVDELEPLGGGQVHGLVGRRRAPRTGAEAFVVEATDRARRHRHPRGQRRRAAAGRLRGHRPRRLRAGPGAEPARPPSRCASRRCPPMRAQGWGRVVAITSVSVRQPIPGLILSNTARAGRHRLPEDARPRGGRRRRHGELRAARLARHGAAALHARRRPDRRGRRRCPPGCSGDRRTSVPWWPSSAPTRPASSRARPSPSTAGRYRALQ